MGRVCAGFKGKVPGFAQGAHVLCSMGLQVQGQLSKCRKPAIHGQMRVTAEDKVIRRFFERFAEGGVDSKLRERQIVVPILVGALQEGLEDTNKGAVGAFDEAISLRVTSGGKSAPDAQVVTDRLKVVTDKFRALIGNKVFRGAVPSNKIAGEPTSDGASVLSTESAEFDKTRKKVDNHDAVLVTSVRLRKKNKVNGD